MPNESMSRVSRHLLAIAAMLLLPQAANGQLLTGIDLSSRSASSASGPWVSQYAVSPTARLDWARLSLDARWTALAREGGGSTPDGAGLTGDGSVSATFRSPARGGLQLSLAGFADRMRLNATTGVSRIGGDARLSYRRGASGTWVGRDVVGDNRPTPVSPTARISAGAWRQWGNALVTLSWSSFGSRVGSLAAPPPTNPSPSSSDSVGASPPPQRAPSSVDSGSTGRFRSWQDAQLSLHWGAGPVALQGLIGTRLFATDQPNETWGEVTGTLAMGPRIAVIAAAGVRPSSSAYGVARSRFIDLGVRVAPSALLRPRAPRGVRPVAAAFEVTDASRGARTIRVRVPHASTVELSGDFTSWEPVTLKDVGGGRWETTLPIASGMHRLVIRVDGDSWTPPPGVSVVADEFQGTVGVIVVP